MVENKDKFFKNVPEDHIVPFDNEKIIPLLSTGSELNVASLITSSEVRAKIGLGLFQLALSDDTQYLLGAIHLGSFGERSDETYDSLLVVSPLYEIKSPVDSSQANGDPKIFYTGESFDGLHIMSAFCLGIRNIPNRVTSEDLQTANLFFKSIHKAKPEHSLTVITQHGVIVPDTAFRRPTVTLHSNNDTGAAGDSGKTYHQENITGLFRNQSQF